MKSMRSTRPGFTLLELLVSVSVTVLMLTMLVALVGATSRSWREGRARLETNQEARVALEILSRDLQSMIIRDTPTGASWLEAHQPETVVESGGVDAGTSMELYFFSPITDRETAVAEEDDPTGTICGLRYVLAHQDPVTAGDAEGGELQMFGLYRDVRSPEDTFNDLLGEENLEDAFAATDPEQEEFLASNIVEFNLSFLVETAAGSRVISPPGDSFVLLSEGVQSSLTGLSGDDGDDARLLAIQINLTILDRRGAELLRQLDAAGETITSRFDSLELFLREHGRQFSQQVPVYSY